MGEKFLESVSLSAETISHSYLIIKKSLRAISIFGGAPNRSSDEHGIRRKSDSRAIFVICGYLKLKIKKYCGHQKFISSGASSSLDALDQKSIARRYSRT